MSSAGGYRNRFERARPSFVPVRAPASQGRSVGLPPRLPPRRRPAPGFTLLELLLVLVLVVVMYSLAAPALKHPFASQRLKKAADQLCAECAKTRVRSVRSGRIHVLQFQPGSNQYQVRPWVAAEDLVEANDATMLGTLGDQALAPSRSVREVQLKLPDQVTLLYAVTDDTRSWSLAEDPEGLNQVDPDWSTPVFFYPDGTTSNATLKLANEYHDQMSVRLRGFTGVARSVIDNATEEVFP